jgi:hypothetical protein
MIQSDELIFFRGVGWNHQPDMVFVVNPGWLQATQRLAWFDIDNWFDIDQSPSTPSLHVSWQGNFPMLLTWYSLLVWDSFHADNLHLHGVPTHISILYYYEWSTCTCLYAASLCWKHRSLDFCFTRSQSWSLCCSHLPWHPLSASRRADSDFPFWVFVAANRLRFVLNS